MIARMDLGFRALQTDEWVIVLHGLARSAAAMKPLAQALHAEGYVVNNLDYPSATMTVEQLVEAHLRPAVDAATRAGATRLHWVGHSMGAILVRQYLAAYGAPAQMGRVVMIGPPNRGSELVDTLGWLPPFRWINGPAGYQLGTAPDSLPNRLGPATVPVGVIAGTRSYNPIYSALIAGPDDGKVSVHSTQLEGMQDFLVLPVNHTFMMRDAEVIRQTLHFLREGRFERVVTQPLR